MATFDCSVQTISRSTGRTATRSAAYRHGLEVECDRTGLRHDRIIISAKVSNVRDLVDVYRRLAQRCDYPLHLGLTESGMGDKGIVASAAGLAILLNEGIGDTIRVSLTPEPGAGREREVEVAQQVLQSMGLRSFLPQVSACPVSSSRSISLSAKARSSGSSASSAPAPMRWSKRSPASKDIIRVRSASTDRP